MADGTGREYGSARDPMLREPITVECPRCGRCYEDWPPPPVDLDVDPGLADPGFVAAACTCTCPHCGHSACIAPSTRER